MRLVVCLAFVLVGFVGNGFAEEKPTLYVGPQVREGFADVDAGIRDSIRDIRDQAKSAGFRVAMSEKGAGLIVIVLGRGIVTNGSVGFGTVTKGSGSVFVVPNNTPTVTALLRVGSYERLLQSVGGTWTYAAKTAVDDIAAWWTANAEAFRAMTAAD